MKIVLLFAAATSALAQGINTDARNTNPQPPVAAPANPAGGSLPAAVLPPAGAAEQPASTGETSVTLDVGFGIRAVLPSRITVPVGEKLRISAPALPESLHYTWTKNGRPIPDATGSVLTIDYVVTSDAGTYQAATVPPPGSLIPSFLSQSLVLGVGPTDRLLNISTRANIGGSGDASLVSGFVVQTGAQPKKLILRAVGPSLTMFGVAMPLRAPVLRVFDSKGQLYTNGYVYPAVVGGPTYESDLAESLARTGAFPIPAGTRDAVVMMPFLPGNYTAQVTSGDGAAGTVLLEIYEVP